MTEFDQVLEQYHRAAAEFVKGDPAPYKELFSHRQDVTLANPFGPVARGWDRVAETMERAAANYRDGEVASIENVANYATEELAYIVEVEWFGRPGGTTVVVLTAIDVLLEPDEATRARAMAVNAMLRGDLPSGFALDETHRPHVTVLQRYVRRDDLEGVFAAVEDVVAARDVAALRLHAISIISAEFGTSPGTTLASVVIEPTHRLACPPRGPCRGARAVHCVGRHCGRLRHPAESLRSMPRRSPTSRSSCRSIAPSTTVRTSPSEWGSRSPSTDWKRARSMTSSSLRAPSASISSAISAPRGRSSGAGRSDDQ